MRMTSTKMGHLSALGQWSACNNEKHSLTSSIYVMFVDSELTFTLIINNSGQTRWLMSFYFLQKLVMSIMKVGISCRNGWRMEPMYI